MNKIIACIDGSSYHHSICTYAAWAAQRTESTVELLHVLGRRETATVPHDYSGNLGANTKDTLLQELAEHDAERAKLAQRRGRMLLDQAKERLHQVGITAETRLRNGSLVDTLLEMEPEARLVIIGKRGEASDYAVGHLGSNLERVIRTSIRPILVASRAYRPITKFLIAYDGSPSAQRAVELAAKDSLLRGLDCHILTAGKPHATQQTQMDAATQQLRNAGLQVQATISQGNPETAIATHVEQNNIDLIVMGAYGHTRIRNLIIGSTTTATIQATHIPILMIR